MPNRDEGILIKYPWVTYKGLPPSFQTQIEAAVLCEVVKSCDGQWNPAFSTSENCIKLLFEDSGFRAQLLVGWEEGSFEDVRRSAALVDHSTRMDFDAETADALGDTQPSVNFYGSTLMNVQGNFVQNHEDNADKVKAWLCERDYAKLHEDIARRRVEGTGDWFIKSAEVEQWIHDAPKQVLWCPGNPGVGKTFTSSRVADHLEKAKQAPTIVVYLNYKRHAEQSLTHILSSMLRQLFSHHPAPTRELYQRYTTQKSRPLDGELCDALRKTILTLGKTYLVLDALDEYLEVYRDDGVADLFRFLTSISPHLKLMVTSRVLGRMESIFSMDSVVRKEILSVDYDIELCLREYIGLKRKFKVCLSDAQVDMVVQEILSVARGRMLLAHLHVQSLSRFFTWGDIRRSLKNLSNQVDLAYSDVLSRIDEQGADEKSIAHQVLLWVSGTRRNLDFRELQHALATKASSENIRDIEDYVYTIDTITGVCAGLVVVDHQDKTVRFIHQTVQEFFQKSAPDYLLHAQQIITETCFQHLSTFDFDDLEKLKRSEGYRLTKEFKSSEPVLARKSAAVVHPEYPFIRYIKSHWSAHLLNCERDMFSNPDAFHSTRLSIYKAGFLSAAQALEPFGNHGWHPSYNSIANPTLAFGKPLTPAAMAVYENIHLAAILDLSHTITMFLNHGISPLTRTNEAKGTTALELAVSLGASRASHLLFRAARSGNDWDEVDHTSILGWSALRGFKSIFTEVLALPEIDINHRDGWDMTPLMCAALGGHGSIVEILLQRHDVDVNARSRDTGVSGALKQAFQGWGDHQAEVVEMLLRDERLRISTADHGSDLRSMSSRVCSTASYLLLQERFYQDFITHTGTTVIGHAASANRLDAVIQLLGRYPETMTKVDVLGRQPITMAAMSGSLEIVEFLLASGADPNAQDRENRSPLLHAVRGGHVGVAEALLRHGADIRVRDHAGHSVLTLAIDSFHSPEIRDLQLIELLLSHQAEVDGPGPGGRTPFSLAAGLADKPLLEVLFNAGAKIHAKDHLYGRTPLSYAVGRMRTRLIDYKASQRRWEAIKFLLDHDADLEDVERYGDTPRKRFERWGDLYVQTELRRYLGEYLDDAQDSDSEPMEVETILYER